jgi:hypothetical protein
MATMLADVLETIADAKAEVAKTEPSNASFRVTVADRPAFMEAVSALYPNATVEMNPSSGVICRVTAPSVPGNLHLYGDKAVIANGFCWPLTEAFATLVIKKW